MHMPSFSDDRIRGERALFRAIHHRMVLRAVILRVSSRTRSRASCAQTDAFPSLTNSWKVRVLWWRPSDRQVFHPICEFVSSRTCWTELWPLSGLKLRGRPWMGVGVQWDVRQSRWAEGFLRVECPADLLPCSLPARFGLMVSFVSRLYLPQSWQESGRDIWLKSRHHSRGWSPFPPS